MGTLSKEPKLLANKHLHVKKEELERLRTHRKNEAKRSKAAQVKRRIFECQIVYIAHFVKAYPIYPKTSTMIRDKMISPQLLGGFCAAITSCFRPNGSCLYSLTEISANDFKKKRKKLQNIEK